MSCGFKWVASPCSCCAIIVYKHYNETEEKIFELTETKEKILELTVTI